MIKQIYLLNKNKSKKNIRLKIELFIKIIFPLQTKLPLSYFHLLDNHHISAKIILQIELGEEEEEEKCYQH